MQVKDNFKNICFGLCLFIILCVVLVQSWEDSNLILQPGMAGICTMQPVMTGTEKRIL